MATVTCTVMAPRNSRNDQGLQDKFVSQEETFGSVTTTENAKLNTGTYCREKLFRTIKWRFRVEDARGNHLFKQKCLMNLGWSETEVLSSKKARETWSLIKHTANKAIQIRRGSTVKSIKEKYVEGACC